MIRFLLIICLALSCNSFNQNTNMGVLEFILNSYFSEFSIERGSEIFISDMKGWTDSTSIVRILNIDSKDIESGKIYSTEYKGNKVYLEYGNLKDNMITLDYSNYEFSIPNKLNWKIIELNNKEDDGITPPEQFDEVQIIYNPTKNCFEESDMMGRLKFKERIKSQFGFCK